VRIGSASTRYEIRTYFVPTVPSPINPSKNHPEVNILNAKSLDFGVNVAEMKLATMHSVENDNIKVTLNLKRKELDIQFPLTIDGANRSLRFRLPISQLSQVHKVDNDSGTESSLIIPFESSPQFFVQKKPSRDDDQLFPAKERNWNDWSTWYRETDVVDDRTRTLLQMIPVMNHKNSAIIDIGKIKHEGK
jgi:RNA-dependent RNA polymerase